MHLPRHLSLWLGALICMLFISVPALAENNYDYYMQKWDENIGMAKNYLDKADHALEENDILLSCSNQRKASEYGIKAIESRIKAIEISGLDEEISRLEIGLEKWKAFGEFCQ